MKALSIRQPWAWLIVNGYKDIENRTWPTRYRGPVLIHASKSMARQEYEDVEDYLAFNKLIAIQSIRLQVRDALERGGIVGVATIDGCIKSMWRTSPWHMEGQFGFSMVDAKPLPFIERKGALGFFDVPPEVTQMCAPEMA